MVGTSPTLLSSAYFGALNLEKAAILCFPQGLPGFETERRFAAIQISGQHPLVYLQSLATRDLCLLAFPIQAISPGFRLELAAEDREVIQSGFEAHDRGDLLALALVAAGEERGVTANLRAPLVVNLRNNLAIQAFQADPGLSYSHPLISASTPC